MSVLIETTIGDFVVDLFVNERPRCSFNFLKLCKFKYYNYSLINFVQENFIAQTGIPYNDVQSGGCSVHGITGTNQPKYFPREFVPKIRHVAKGMVSFVNNFNEEHGSQFFITLADSLVHLDANHTVFGFITEGISIIDKLNATICDKRHRPYQDIRISHTLILDDPFEDPSFYIYPPSPPPNPELLMTDRIGAEECLEDFKGLTTDQIQQVIEDRELKTGTRILEMVGDIPDADMKPPENVLFICKLNPDTLEKDLKIIFSRFGKVLSCDIVRDHKTGDSLQYGFVEFEKVEDCEKAYFKMDNVIIDDRRIHVDFCQSIHRSQWNKTKLSSKYKLPSNVSDDKSRKIEHGKKSSRDRHERKRSRESSTDNSPSKRKKKDKKHHVRRHDTPSVRSFR